MRLQTINKEKIRVRTDQYSQAELNKLPKHLLVSIEFIIFTNHKKEGSPKATFSFRGGNLGLESRIPDNSRFRFKNRYQFR